MDITIRKFIELKDKFAELQKSKDLLVQEVKIKDMILKRQENMREAFREELKMLNSVLRVPRMCDQFHKAMRRKMEAEAYQKMMAEAMSNLNTVRDEDESDEKFIDDFMEHLDNDILKGRRRKFR